MHHDHGADYLGDAENWRPDVQACPGSVGAIGNQFQARDVGKLDLSVPNPDQTGPFEV